MNRPNLITHRNLFLVGGHVSGRVSTPGRVSTYVRFKEGFHSDGPQLPIRVQTPSPEGPVRSQGERVTSPRESLDPVCPHSDLIGQILCYFRPVSQLTSCVGTPSPKSSIRSHRKEMIVFPFAEVSSQTLPRPGHRSEGILPAIPPRQLDQAIV